MEYYCTKLEDAKAVYDLTRRQLSSKEDDLELTRGKVVRIQKTLEDAVSDNSIAQAKFNEAQSSFSTSEKSLRQALLNFAETQEPFVKKSIKNSVRSGHFFMAYQFATNSETHVKSDGYQRLCIMLDSSGSLHPFYDDMQRSAKTVFDKVNASEFAAVNIGTYTIASPWTNRRDASCLSEVLDIRQRVTKVEESKLEALLGIPFGAIMVTDGDFYDPETARQSFMNIAGPETQNQLAVIILKTNYSRFTPEKVAQNFDFADCYFVKDIKQLEEFMVSYARYLCAGHCKPLPITKPATVTSV